MIYSVIDKQSQQEVYRYAADTPVEWPAYPFAAFDHVAETVINPDGSIEGVAVRVWSRLEFLRRFTQAERISIREASKVSAVLEDYLKILDITTEVRSDDPDTIASLHMLEQAGLIAAGRVTEILNV